MSSAYVRDSFRTKVATLLVAEGFEFIETINLAESTGELPPKWFTLDFLPADDTRMSLGVPALFRETGAVTLAIFTPQHERDTEAIAAADVVRSALCNWIDTTGNLRVHDAQPPADLDGGDFRGSFYGVTVDIRYSFDRIE